MFFFCAGGVLGAGNDPRGVFIREIRVATLNLDASRWLVTPIEP